MAAKGQGSLLQVMGAVVIVSVLILVLFTTQTTTSAQAMEQQAQQQQSYLTTQQLNTLVSTSYYLETRQNVDITNVISHWCEYDSYAALSGVETDSDGDPLEAFQLHNYIQQTLDQIIAGPYQLQIDCYKGTGQTYRLGSIKPDTGDIFTARLKIPDQTNPSDQHSVTLSRWN